MLLVMIFWIVLAVLNQIFKFDSVMITKKEIVNSIVYYDYFGEKKVALASADKLKTRWNETVKMKKGEIAPKSPEKKPH